MSDEMTMDISQFLKGMDLLQELTFAQAKEGLRAAGDKLLEDVKNQEPRPPHDDGHLDRSCRLDLSGLDQGLVISVAVGAGGTAVFNVPYAHRWHEAENDIDQVTGRHINWSEGGVGPKYIETKIVRNGMQYMEIGANAIRHIMTRSGLIGG